MDITDKQKVWMTLNLIPEGYVVTYGQLAELSGLSRQYARVIGTVLSQLPQGSHLPWHRVVNHKGMLSFAPATPRYKEQRQRLEKEGIEFKNEKIAFSRFQWIGTHV